MTPKWNGAPICSPPVQLTIAMPAYNEVENLERAVGEARDAARRVCAAASEVLIVDDGSSDGTGALADGLAARWPDVRVIHHATNRGFSGAMASCFRSALGDHIFLAAADGQTDMSALDRAYVVAADADIVVGVRVARTEGAERKILSWGFHLIARTLFLLPEREFSSSFLFRRALFAGMPFRASARSAVILPEVLYRARRRGARTVEIPVTPRPRWAGTAKGGRLSVAFVTLLELVRVAALARWDERRREVPRTALGSSADQLS